MLENGTSTRFSSCVITSYRNAHRGLMFWLA
jgi:hypothetical protein